MQMFRDEQPNLYQVALHIIFVKKVFEYPFNKPLHLRPDSEGAKWSKNSFNYDYVHAVNL